MISVDVYDGRIRLNGKCPKNRIVNTPDGEPELNYLCPGSRMFYKHTEPCFEFMANELQNKRLPSNVKKWALSRPQGNRNACSA